FRADRICRLHTTGACSGDVVEFAPARYTPARHLHVLAAGGANILPARARPVPPRAWPDRVALAAAVRMVIRAGTAAADRALGQSVRHHADACPFRACRVRAVPAWRARARGLRLRGRV